MSAKIVKIGREATIPFVHVQIMYGSHQGNTESVSMKLGMLGTKKVPCKRFEALPILTVSRKRVEEAWGIVAECFGLTGPPYGQKIWVKRTTLVLAITANSFNGTLHETLGVRFGALLWIADFYAIAPNRLEARGVDYTFTEAYRLYTIA